MKFSALISAATAVCATAMSAGAPASPSCDPDNGGISLPQGFCAFVAADGLGVARHLAVAPNGDVYVALMRSGGRGQPRKSGVMALRDADGDGRFETKELIDGDNTTGVALHNGYLYVAHPLNV